MIIYYVIIYCIYIINTGHEYCNESAFTTNHFWLIPKFFASYIMNKVIMLSWLMFIIDSCVGWMHWLWSMKVAEDGVFCHLIDCLSGELDEADTRVCSHAVCSRWRSSGPETLLKAWRLHRCWRASSAGRWWSKRWWRWSMVSHAMVVGYRSKSAWRRLMTSPR